MTYVLLAVLVLLVALNLAGTIILIQRKPEQKAKIGRPRGSKNRAAQLANPVDHLANVRSYFGPAIGGKAQLSDDDMAAYVQFVNQGVIADEAQMIDPLDEFRTGTGYAGT